MTDIKKLSLKNKINEKAIGTGLISGILASLCCVVPLVIILLGVGGLSVALGFAKYRSYFIAFSFIFIIIVAWLLSKRKASCCSPENRKYFIGTAIATAIIFFVLIVYVITPIVYRFIG